MPKGPINTKFIGESYIDNWTFAGAARECLNDMEKAIEECDADKLARRALCVGMDSEAAFSEYNRGLKTGIDEDTMQAMKDKAERYISKFYRKCMCDTRENI